MFFLLFNLGFKRIDFLLVGLNDVIQMNYFLVFDVIVFLQINYFVYLDELGCLSLLVNHSLASELLQPLLDLGSLGFELIGHHHH